jgi:acyl-CoA reductase-like NAD-dependent aldehyde dehydrogenase
MMIENDDAPAIPLWINGHAYLTMVATFFNVCNPITGDILRRTPLCGADEAIKAVEAAQGALLRWAAEAASARAALLADVALALEGYADHFARLIVEETGKDAAAAATEVAEAVALLRGAVAGDVAGVVAVVSDDTAPLLGPLSRAVPALAPSPIFALAELTARNAFPCGVFNILQGDEAAIEGLCAASGVSVLQFSGAAALAARIGAMAVRYSKPFNF